MLTFLLSVVELSGLELGFEGGKLVKKVGFFGTDVEEVVFRVI